ncbi:MAG: hypothetical protein ACOZBL_02295 [Patescibacteria group bacterium]
MTYNQKYLNEHFETAKTIGSIENDTNHQENLDLNQKIVEQKNLADL